MTDWTRISSAGELAEAAKQPGARIELAGQIDGLASVALAPGVQLRGGTLRFGSKGLRLSRDNTLSAVSVEAAEHEPAIFNDTEQRSLGTLVFNDVRTVGQVLLLAHGAVKDGHVEVNGLHVARADMRGRIERPHGFGVEAMQGAFTLWNRQGADAVTITARLLDISAGSLQTPVRGSGVFVSGHGGDGGTVTVELLETGALYSDGGIQEGAADLISGGVFTLHGAVLDRVVNTGAVSTFGPNDMVLDNWGTVGEWVALEPITSHGPSGIGFVNFGVINRLDVRAPLATHGRGARGFNLYDGSLELASFQSITTEGDGAVGIQVTKSLPTIEVRGDVITTGGRGFSLVKGVQTPLPAVALSIPAGGEVGEVRIGGRLQTSGDDVVTMEVDGRLGRISAAAGISALGANSDAVHLGDESLDLSGVAIDARDGEALVRPGG
jgi:hypothetical protein